MSTTATLPGFQGPKPAAAPEAARAICARHGDKPDRLIEILHDLQHELGHVPQETLPAIAQALNLSRAEVYGVVTFYHDFHLEPQPKHVIRICAAEACQSMGARGLIAKAEALAKGKPVAIAKTYCLGLCAQSPSMMVNGKVVAKVDDQKLADVLAELAP